MPGSGAASAALLLLLALVAAERLTEEFAANLLSWTHTGFSAYLASRVDALDLDGLERLGRYVTRPALAQGAVTIRDDGRVDVATPPDPRTGSTCMTLDALEFVQAVVAQIPDARKHLVRYYGAYSHRRRAAVRERNGAAAELAGTPTPPDAPEPVTPAEPGSPEAKRRSAWARVLKRVFEVDPLVCPRCGGEMKLIAWITDRAVIDRILAHRQKAGLESPFEARGPPTPG